MADTKITGLTALTGAGSATGDLLAVVDVSDVTMAASGTDKQITIAELLIGLGALPKAGGTMTGTITSTIGTITVDTPALTATQTWNAAGVTFDAILVDVTRTASSTTSNLLRLRQGGTDYLRVGGNDGSATVQIVPSCAIVYSGNQWALDFFYGYRVGTGKGIFFSSTTSFSGTLDLGLVRSAAGVLEVNSSTAGTYRDILVRSILIDGAPSTAAAGQVAIGADTRTTIGANGAASALTANPVGYIDINVAGTAYQIPYYTRGA